jgi:hypothetical protein
MIHVSVMTALTHVMFARGQNSVPLARAADAALGVYVQRMALELAAPLLTKPC